MKIDPYKNQKNYASWKEECKNQIPNINEENSKVILKFLTDMEMGLNVGKGSKKGSRSFARLRTLKDRMIFVSRISTEMYRVNSITELKDDQVHTIFTNMEKGVILKNNGKPYISVADYVKVFKTFWHWWQKVNRKEGREVPDITADLDVAYKKPRWVYLTEEDIKKLCSQANFDYKTLMMFLFDSGIRAPTELLNIKVSDIFNNFKELQIRDEISKTFGRRIKLMFCSNILEEYVRTKNLKPEDFLFKKHYSIINRYLKRLGEKILGDKMSPAGQKYSELTMYDFRHCSCCYWLPRYKSESALKYRFGWKKSEKIHYYSELLGMRDTIAEDDMLIDVTKTEIEKNLQRTNKENDILKERVQTLEMQVAKIMEMVKQVEVLQI